MLSVAADASRIYTGAQDKLVKVLIKVWQINLSTFEHLSNEMLGVGYGNFLSDAFAGT